MVTLYRKFTVPWATTFSLLLASSVKPATLKLRLIHNARGVTGGRFCRFLIKPGKDGPGNHFSIWLLMMKPKLLARGHTRNPFFSRKGEKIAKGTCPPEWLPPGLGKLFSSLLFFVACLTITHMCYTLKYNYML